MKDNVENWRSAGYGHDLLEHACIASAEPVVDRVGVAVGALLNCPPSETNLYGLS